MVGDKELSIHPNFRIYFATKLSNPIFRSSIYSKCLVVDFNITQHALETDLLGMVIRSEHPELENQWKDAQREIDATQHTIANLKENLLRATGKCPDSLLDNVELKLLLKSTRLKVDEMATTLETMRESHNQLETQREHYRTVARKGSQLCFVLFEMAVVHPMYQFSLTAFEKLFSESLLAAKCHSDLDDRLRMAIERLTTRVYEFGCLAISEKLLFAFQIATKMQISDEELSQKDVNFFINTQDAFDASPTEVAPEWLPDEKWLSLSGLNSSFPNRFDRYLSNMLERSADWETWYNAREPEEIDFPGEDTQILKPFDVSLFANIITCQT